MIRFPRHLLAGVMGLLLCGAAAMAQTPVATPDDPVARALLAAKPQTPAELLRTSRILVDLGHASVAAPLVNRLAEMKLDDEILAALVEEFGSEVLMRLARERALNPAASKLSNTALSGAQRYARNPARLSALVDSLKAASAEEWATIVAQLRRGGDAAVVALVSVLADPARANEHLAASNALVALGEVSTAPLIALLSSREPDLVARVARILGAGRDPASADHLLAPALAAKSPRQVAAAARSAMMIFFGRLPVVEQAGARLERRARRELDESRRLSVALVEAGLPPSVWQWNDETHQLSSVEVSPRAAKLLAAMEFAADARRLLPEDSRIRQLFNLIAAETAALADRVPKDAANHFEPARQLIAQLSVDELRDVLALAMRDDWPEAGVVAAQQLGDSADVSVLYARSPQLSELARAVESPARELRFAALTAIMKLAPSEPYPGAGRVGEALEFFARSAGAPRALAAAATPLEAGRVAGMLAALGYEPDAATDAAGALRTASGAADYEVIFVDSTLGRPASGELLQRLQTDSRTARIPLAIVSFAEEYPEVERLAEKLPPTVPVIRVQNEAGMQVQLARVLETRGRRMVDRDERRAQGVQALAWIAELSGRRRPLYDLRRLDATVIANLDAPGMTEAAITTAAKLNSPRVQRALIDLASRLAAPLATRQAAASAFAKNVAAHGTLLSSSEILAQYERYNASETQPKETQQLLGALLDTIEARAKADAVALERPAGQGN